MRSSTWSVAAAAAAACLLAPLGARAFCGFYVGSADSPLTNNATMVVMMREGQKTVLSMQNDYQGPAEDFAMVVPVPVVLREADVKTLPRDVFDRVDRLAAPRLVEYWEQDPCPEARGTIGLGNLGTIGHGAGSGSGYGRGAGGAPLVTVEAEFAVGEYDIVILSATDSAALDTWLRQNRYNIPEGAEAVLRPYVEQGMKFFVAKVDVDRVTFEDGRGLLSPLRVQYDDETFRLPVRLGLLNSPGTQDLVVHILARNQRYEAANYPNVTIPTNVDVADEVRDRFGEFYAALFDRTVAQSRGAVVTEYAWQATNCDPCPGPVLSEQDLLTLGGDVVLPDTEHVAQPAFPGRQMANVPQVRVGPVRVEGSMSDQVIRRVVRRHINEARFCYERELNRNPALAGTIGARFTIASTGATRDVAEEGSAMPSAAARECVQTAIRRWTFPAPEGEEPVVHLQFTFSMGQRSVSGGGRSIGWGGMGGPFQSFVLTRLHYRYEEDGLGEDLAFRVAEPIVGGREMRDNAGALEKDAQPAPANNFQGRYAIRHPWEGPIECDEPIRGVWGGPPEAVGTTTPRAATGTATAPRGRIDLASMLKQDIPAIGVVVPSAGAGAEAVGPAEAPTASPPAASSGSGGGCGGCSATSADTAAALFPLLLVLAARLRRR
jgi:MYXO-CTERM domain-containing protein